MANPFLFMVNNRVIEACAIGYLQITLQSRETIAFYEKSVLYFICEKSVALWFSLSLPSLFALWESQLDNVAFSIDGKVFLCVRESSVSIALEKSQFQFYVRYLCLLVENQKKKQWLKWPYLRV